MRSKDWYVSQFPEAMFLCSSAHAREYSEAVVRGHAIAATSSVLVCGIARNAERVLPYTIARIEALCKLFKSHYIHVFENDSTDNTLNILSNWSKANSQISVGSAKFNPPPFTDPHGYDRRKYMAMARNEYLKFARKYSQTHLIDYMIIVDMDLHGGWSYHGVLNTIGQQTYWDIVGSNSLFYTKIEDRWCKLFYDSWAFRPLDHPEPLEDEEVNLFKFNRGEAMIPINSAFGGLGIYKPHFLSEDLKYAADDCDHPTLHNELVKRGYKIFLNPSQITLYNKTVYTI